MANITELQFTVTLGGLPAGTFFVVDFELREALNAPFSLDINLACLLAAHTRMVSGRLMPGQVTNWPFF